MHLYFGGSLCDPLPLNSILKLAVTKLVGSTSSSHINCSSLNSSSFISGQDLYTTAGIPSGPVAFPMFSFFTAWLNSFLVIGSWSVSPEGDGRLLPLSPGICCLGRFSRSR